MSLARSVQTSSGCLDLHVLSIVRNPLNQSDLTATYKGTLKKVEADWLERNNLGAHYNNNNEFPSLLQDIKIIK